MYQGTIIELFSNVLHLGILMGQWILQETIMSILTCDYETEFPPLDNSMETTFCPKRKTKTKTKTRRAYLHHCSHLFIMCTLRYTLLIIFLM